MKKLLLFITGILAIGAFLSCSGDEPKMTGQDADSSVREPFSTNTNLRTLEEAAAIVRANMGLLGETGSRSAACRSFNPSSAKMVVNYGKSRAQLPDTLMYVFNFDNDEGFAIVAADRRLEGLIAITEKGSYDPEVGSEIPGLRYYMEIATANIKADLDSLNNLTPVNKTPYNFKDSINPDIPFDGGNTGGTSTLAQQKWTDDTVVIAYAGARLGNFQIGQHFPEGMLCPNGVCGCTATAMYMAMCYFEHPAQLYIDYDSNKELINIDWPDLKQHRKSFYHQLFLDYDGCPTERHQTIARICRYLGYHIDAVYGYKVNQNGDTTYCTGAYSDPCIAVMKKMGFEVTVQTDYSKYNEMTSFVGKDAIVLLFAQLYTGGGHTWIMDGYSKTQYTRNYYIKYDGDPNWYPNGTAVNTTELTHQNWGWNGKSNGWFVSGNFSPKHVNYPDNGNSAIQDTTQYYNSSDIAKSMLVVTITK